MSHNNYPVFGMIFGPAGTSTSGLSLVRRQADTSVDRDVFTNTPSGLLMWTATRAEGIHTSVSRIMATGALGPDKVITERKVFYIDSDRGKTSGFADWNIFNASGTAVGAANGTTDTDVSPEPTWNSN